jgi:hypothetical protein
LARGYADLTADIRRAGAAILQAKYAAPKAPQGALPPATKTHDTVPSNTLKTNLKTA